MKKEIKIILILVGICLFIASLSLAFMHYKKNSTQLHTGFHATIKGEIKNAPNGSQYIFVHHSFGNDRYICQAGSIADAKISFDSKTNKSRYVATFWLPIEEEVIVTPNCYSCSNKRVFVSKDDPIKVQDIEWDTTSCNEETEEYTDAEKALDRADVIIAGAEAKLSEMDFNSSIRQKIRQYIVDGREEIRDAKNSRASKSENQSLFHANYAILYAWKAFHKIEVEELNTCLRNMEKVISNHSDECFTIPFEVNEAYWAANQSRFSNNMFDYMDQKHYTNFDELNKIQEDIEGVLRNRNQVSFSSNHCDSGLRMMQRAFEHQTPYCNRQKITWRVFNGSLIFLGIVVGFVIGKLGRRWNHEKKKR